MGPYEPTTTGSRFIVVATDLFSRWTEAIACADVRTEIITRFLEKDVFARFGFPRNIISDNGPQFLSQQFDAKLEAWGCFHYTIPIYTPRSNPVERRNQELKTNLRVMRQRNPDEKWHRLLPAILSISSTPRRR